MESQVRYSRNSATGAINPSIVMKETIFNNTINTRSKEKTTRNTKVVEDEWLWTNVRSEICLQQDSVMTVDGTLLQALQCETVYDAYEWFVFFVATEVTKVENLKVGIDAAVGCFSWKICSYR